MAKNLISEVALRDFTPEDALAVVELEQQLFPDDWWDIPMFISEIAHPLRWYQIVYPLANPSEILGYFGIMVVGDTADIQNIATIKPGCGIGQLMLRELTSEAIRRGATNLMLEVRVDNDRAIKVYEAAGFSRIAQRKNYYHTPRGAVDAYIYQKQIA